MKSWYKWQGAEYGLKRTASLGYLWSRDFKTLAAVQAHKILNPLRDTRSSKPCVHPSDLGIMNPKVADKDSFQHQGDVFQQRHKRSVGRSDPPPA